MPAVAFAGERSRRRWAPTGMNRHISMARLPLLGALFIISTGCDAEPPHGDASIPIRYRAFADAFEQERRALGIPGAAVAIVEHGELAFARGFGTKGQGSDEPVDAATSFRIGSRTTRCSSPRASTTSRCGSTTRDSASRSR